MPLKTRKEGTTVFHSFKVCVQIIIASKIIFLNLIALDHFSLLIAEMQKNSVKSCYFHKE